MTFFKDPVPKKMHCFWNVFGTRLFKHKICKIAQERFFCLQRQKSVFQRSPETRGMGPPQGPTFVSAVPTLNKTKKQKLKKTTSFVDDCYSNKVFCVFATCAKMFYCYKNPFQNLPFFQFLLFGFAKCGNSANKSGSLRRPHPTYPIGSLEHNFLTLQKKPLLSDFTYLLL